MHLDGIEIQTDFDLTAAMLQLFKRKTKELGLSEEANIQFKKFIDKDKELIKEGGKPQIVLAARMYAISLIILEPRYQEEVSRAFDVSEGGLRNFFHRMYQKSRGKKT